MAKEGQFTRNEAMNALERIYELYPKISVRSIERFAPIYYPIAIIEMQLDERSFENFESVQLTVLKMVSLGIIDYTVIAQTLGLSNSYVQKMLHLLVGCGHIEHNQITQMGRDSLNAGQKITQTRVWQKFQVDALNATLIKVDQTVEESMLSDRSQTSLWVGHLDYMEGISAQTIISQVEGSNYSQYVQQKDGLLNVNATKIHDIRCVEIKYAKAYLMKLREFQQPIVFSQRVDEAQKNRRDKYSWQPFAVPSQEFRRCYDVSVRVPISTQLANEYLMQIYNLIEKSRQDINDIRQVAREVIERSYAFHQSGFGNISASGSKIVITLQAKAFDGVSYWPWAIHMLLGLKMHGEYLVTNERLYGALISIRTSDAKILKVANLLAQKINQYGQGDVTKRLRESCKNSETNLLDTLARELGKI